jgi:hypothetical protein
VQVSPHHWRVSDSHRKDSIFETPINMSPLWYIGFSGGIQSQTDKALMKQGLGTRQILTEYGSIAESEICRTPLG